MNTFKKQAAVTKYLPLISEGRTEEEIKAALTADEKTYSPAEVDEIYQALIAPAKVKLQVNYGVQIPELRQAFTKAEIEADQAIIDYLIEIKSGAVTVLQEDKL